MKGKDLATTLGILYDKRSLMRGNMAQLGPSQQTQSAKLMALESKFNEFASTLKGETIIAERIE